MIWLVNCYQANWFSWWVVSSCLFWQINVYFLILYCKWGSFITSGKQASDILSRINMLHQSFTNLWNLYGWVWEIPRGPPGCVCIFGLDGNWNGQHCCTTFIFAHTFSLLLYSNFFRNKLRHNPSPTSWVCAATSKLTLSSFVVCLTITPPVMPLACLSRNAECVLVRGCFLLVSCFQIAFKKHCSIFIAMLME